MRVVIKTLGNAKVGQRNTDLIDNINKNTCVQVRLHKTIEKIKIERGVRQGDVISPKLFALAFQDVFK